mmetsp:Transcript_18171/g.40296  ORF Transcript_18171/g.40296 Transcript_18171/m.40296 type:complete len:271 (+) Transcript_18171:2392-3204(+)
MPHPQNHPKPPRQRVAGRCGGVWQAVTDGAGYVLCGLQAVPDKSVEGLRGGAIQGRPQGAVQDAGGVRGGVLVHRCARGGGGLPGVREQHADHGHGAGPLRAGREGRPVQHSTYCGQARRPARDARQPVELLRQPLSRQSAHRAGDEPLGLQTAPALPQLPRPRVQRSDRLVLPLARRRADQGGGVFPHGGGSAGGAPGQHHIPPGLHAPGGDRRRVSLCGGAAQVLLRDAQELPRLPVQLPHPAGPKLKTHHELHQAPGGGAAEADRGR